MNDFIYEPIRNEEDLRYFLACMRFEGVAFHPEDDVADYIHYKTKEKSFTDKEVAAITKRQDEMYQLDIDPCEVAIHVNEVADLANSYNIENSKKVDDCELILHDITKVCDNFVNKGGLTPLETLTKVISILENNYLFNSIDNGYK